MVGIPIGCVSAVCRAALSFVWRIVKQKHAHVCVRAGAIERCCDGGISETLRLIVAWCCHDAGVDVAIGADTDNLEFFAPDARVNGCGLVDWPTVISAHDASGRARVWAGDVVRNHGGVALEINVEGHTVKDVLTLIATLLRVIRVHEVSTKIAQIVRACIHVGINLGETGWYRCCESDTGEVRIHRECGCSVWRWVDVYPGGKRSTRGGDVGVTLAQSRSGSLRGD